MTTPTTSIGKPSVYDTKMRECVRAFAHENNTVRSLATRFKELDRLLHAAPLAPSESVAGLLFEKHASFDGDDYEPAGEVITETLCDRAVTLPFCAWFRAWTDQIVTAERANYRGEVAWEDGAWDVFKLLARSLRATPEVRECMATMQRELDRRNLRRQLKRARRDKERARRDKRRKKRRAGDSDDDDDDDDDGDDDGGSDEDADDAAARLAGGDAWKRAHHWPTMVAELFRLLATDPFVALHPIAAPVASRAHP